MLRAYAEDLWAIGLAALAVLAGLALYLGALGPAGRAVRTGLSAGLGVGRFLLPPALVAVGVLLLARRRPREPVRSVLGIALLLVGVSGLAELAAGSPGFGAPVHVLGSAGGWLGVLSGHLPGKVLSGPGAAVVLVAICAVGMVVLTGFTIRRIASAVAGGFRGVEARIDELRAMTYQAGDSEVQAGGSGDEAGLDLMHEAAVPSGAPDDPTARSTDCLLGTSRSAERAIEVPGGEEAGAEHPADGLASAGSLGLESDAAAGRPGSAGPGGEGARRRPPLGSRADQLELDLGHQAGDWRLPPAKLLKLSKAEKLDSVEVLAAGQQLVEALAAHGVETRLVGHTVGPTVTRFELELGPGVKVARVTSLSRDIAYAMASPDVRILAPIPGKSAIGVEVPNRRRQLVTLGDILASAEARSANHPLQVAIGRDIAGRPVLVNLAEMPHLLISGATGAGKSSCINSILTSVLMRSTPEQVRMILVDPKRVELGQYNGLPHLLTSVVVDPKKAANALQWAVTEMERRYDLLAEAGLRDITGYNAAVARGDLMTESERDSARLADLTDAAIAGASCSGPSTGSGGDGAGHQAAPSPEDDAGGDPAAGTEVGTEVGTGGGEPAAGTGSSRPARHRPLPFVLVVVDELNDLMMVAARDVEESICRIAQMARAVGIHLVIATQRPSVDVITGLIKANIPSRLAFSVSSLADSRVILDQPGAERLVGKGDMLLLTASSSVPRRIQGPWVTEEEVRSVVAAWRRQRQPEYVEGLADQDTPAGHMSGDGEEDDLLQAAMELVVRSQLGSTSMLQRKLRVGFSRAGRLMDLLERRGVVGPSEGSKARSVLMTPEELDGIPES